MKPVNASFPVMAQKTDALPQLSRVLRQSSVGTQKQLPMLSTDTFSKCQPNVRFQGGYDNDELNHLINMNWENFKVRNRIPLHIKEPEDLMPHEEEAWDKSVTAVEKFYESKRGKPNVEKPSDCFKKPELKSRVMDVPNKTPTPIKDE